MEKTRRLPRKTKGHLFLCIPKLRGDACSTTKISKPPSAMTLLERLREAVFRLIMLCALSKATNHTGTGFTDVRRHSYPNVDHHHSEAVADCIEFIKKKACSDDENHDTSSESSSRSMDAEADMAVPMTVM